MMIPAHNQPIMSGQQMAQATEAEQATLTGEVAIALALQAELTSQIAQQVLMGMIVLYTLQGMDSTFGRANFKSANGEKSELAEKPSPTQNTLKTDTKHYTSAKNGLTPKLMGGHKHVPHLSTEARLFTPKSLSYSQLTLPQSTPNPNDKPRTPITSRFQAAEPKAQTMQPSSVGMGQKAFLQAKETKPNALSTTHQARGNEPVRQVSSSLQSPQSAIEELRALLEEDDYLQQGGEGGQHKREQNNQDEDQTGEQQDIKVSSITSTKKDPAVQNAELAQLRETVEYGNQESKLLSEVMGRRVSQFDVLILFIEFLKLEIKGRREERISRLQERAFQLKHLEKVVDSFKSQGRALLIAGVGSGVLGIIAGGTPILGHMKGDAILGRMQTVFTSLEGMESKDFFKGVSRMTHTASQMQKSYGDIQSTFAQGNRAFDERMTDLHKTDGEENTRTMEEIKDGWRSIENFLYQHLQMNHDTIRMLYGQ